MDQRWNTRTRSREKVVSQNIICFLQLARTDLIFSVLRKLLKTIRTAIISFTFHPVVQKKIATQNAENLPNNLMPNTAFGYWTERNRRRASKLLHWDLVSLHNICTTSFPKYLIRRAFDEIYEIDWYWLVGRYCHRIRLWIETCTSHLLTENNIN